ncbi:MAG: TonB-dependent receptor [Candidatus Marinimicrobia bacterium]|nr:TonB-dependent receptor [Candidatus Neomarinimicrobiota bacterium]
MFKAQLKIIFAITIILLLPNFIIAGVTGKIMGTVTDAQTGDPLIGANIIINESSMGAATDIDGNYIILNVPPGEYDLTVMMIGYTKYSVNNIRVEIDLTNHLDVNLKTEVLEGEMVVVQAERKIIRVDVAASQKSVSGKDIEQLPVSTLSDVIGLQAGVSGFSIRGGGSDQTMLLVDGLTMNDERNNKPTTNIPLSAIQDLSVQTGGFGAEYNNVRSGIVNVVTKEGAVDHYSGSISIRYSPTAQKHFGISPFSEEAFYLRPYLDEEVCWTGTNNGNWDKYTQRQYAQFDGWNSIAAQTLADDDPTNNLTPEGAKKLYTWEHRKEGAIDKPDYNIDAGFGGPVPFISSYLGNLRFFGSYRREKDMYLFQISREALLNETAMLKLTSDLSPTMKLTFNGIYSEIEGTSASRGGGTALMEGTWYLASSVDRDGFTMPWRLYTDNYWCPTTVFSNTVSAKLIHQLSQKTFYSMLVKRSHKYYRTWHGTERDTTWTKEVLPGYIVDQSPVGFSPFAIYSIDGKVAFGGSVSSSRDTSRITTYTYKADLKSQINSTNEIKTGFEFVYNDLKMEYGSENAVLPDGNYWTSIDQQPYRLKLYGQDKLEYKGFVGSVGLTLDYNNVNGQWYNIDIYDNSFYSSSYNAEEFPDSVLSDIEPTLTLSPRLSISHPITETSKLYFNYGHYHQTPIAEDLYQVMRGNTNAIDYIGDPTLPLAKTISYELGFDQAMLNSYLIHVSAYYKDISDQQDYTDFISADSRTIYSQLTANSYEDIRGLELEFNKIRGEWITGFINYEYRVNTWGYFGVDNYFENISEQREYESKNRVQSKPIPKPRMKSVIDLHVPGHFGIKALREWHLNLITRWTAGSWFTFNPNGIPGIEYNVQWKDSWAVNMKVSKIFRVGNANIKFFVDVNNLLNLRQFSGYGFIDGFDYNYYMGSLMLHDKVREEIGLNVFPGLDKNDRPGDYRPDDVEYVPLEWISDVTGLTNPSERAIYYDNATDNYVQYSSDDGWQDVDSKYFDQVIEDKAYIDMPNQSGYVFLNPRDIFMGISISFDL